MNWGNRLLIVFACFAVLIGTMVYKCMHQDFELVSKDYYNEELRYQDKIDGMQNAGFISKLTLSQTDSTVSIGMPKELDGKPLTGQVYFYCAMNASKDIRLPLQVNSNNIMHVNKARLTGFRYTVKLSLQSENKPYYYEQALTIKL